MLAAERANNFTLAGFSLAALTFFLTLGGTKGLVITDTTFYLSVSLVCFVVAAYLFPINVNRAFPYAADTFEVLGLLSVAIAMLSFFTSNFAIAYIQTVYILFVLSVVGIAILQNYYSYKVAKPKPASR
jgi:hypothetical protein